jgi:hypothetical protein
MATINYERKELVDTWCVDDVQSVRADLTDEQAFEVLCRVAHNFDANYGIGWDTLKITADELFPKEQDEDYGTEVDGAEYSREASQ